MMPRQMSMSRLSDLLSTKLGSKLFTGTVLVVALGVVALFAAPSYRQSEPGIAGQRPHDFAFELNGRQTHLSDLRGRIVVLNFWASWCPPCVEEISSLNALHNKIKGRGATVLGVSVDVDQTLYEKFLKEHNVPFPNYRDASGKIPGIYGTVMYPETYIIGADGRILRKIIGPQAWDGPEMSGYLDSLLQGPAR
jgi:peroxiredoxin